MADIAIASLEGGQVSVNEEAFVEFRAALRGPVLLPGDVGYQEACVIFNGMHKRRPAVIVQCSGAADVVDSVNFARQNNLLVAVKGGGHNSAGNSLCDGGLVIDLSGMNGVHVDVQARIARCGGGANWHRRPHAGRWDRMATPKAWT